MTLVKRDISSHKHITAKMSHSLLLALLLVLIASSAFAEKCNPTASIKSWQKYSPCAHRTKLGVLIGFGYNVNLPHAKGDLEILGIDRNDIPKGVIVQGHPEECDCEQSVCLTPEQSQLLFDINVDRALKQASNLIPSTSTPCCGIQDALTGLFFTFGVEHLMRVPDLLFYMSSSNWQKLGAALLTPSWCKLSNRCTSLAERIMEGCNNTALNLGCSPPTPQACDAAGDYCCAHNDTCCRYSKQTRNSNFFPPPNQAYWCCPLSGAVCCRSSNSCCPRAYPVCCGNTNSCCFVKYPVCCFPGTSQAYCCAASSPVCLGGQHCGSLDPEVKPVKGKANKR